MKPVLNQIASSLRLKIMHKRLDHVREHKDNPRKHPEPDSPEWNALRTSLRNDYFDPMIYNRRNGCLVSGALRRKVLMADGVQSADMVEVDYDEMTHKARMVAANESVGEKLAAILQEVANDPRAGKLTAMTDAQIAALLQSAQPEKIEDQEQNLRGKALQRKWKTAIGQVWQLGEHRLACGDATESAMIKRLMNGDQAHMIFTDPPYGVSYQGGGFSVIEGDRKRDDALIELITNAMKRAVEHSTVAAAFYIWHTSNNRSEFSFGLRAAGLVERQLLIWAKPRAVLGHMDYHQAHEPCFYANKAGEKIAFYGDRTQPTVWHAAFAQRKTISTVLGQALVLRDGQGNTLCLLPRLPKAKKARAVMLRAGERILIDVNPKASDLWEVGPDQEQIVHPTQKPIELARRAIENSSRTGQIVLDQFGGSGSTLIAAEHTGRRARICDMDPIYVATMLQRYAGTFPKNKIKPIKS